MLFTTDQQTLEDLNIFGKHSGASIYSLFNHTNTAGGALLMEDMFRYPLSDAININKRSGIIQYFTALPVFPFDNELFAPAEQYLDNTDERTKLSHNGDTVIRKFNNMIAEDADYKFVHGGVTALIGIINSLRKFTAALVVAAESPYQEELNAIYSLLSTPVFDTLPVLSNKSRLSYAKLAELDVQLRFGLREPVKKLLRHIYCLDVYISVAQVAAARNFIFPKALPKEMHRLELEGVCHPGLNNPVTNSFDLNSQQNISFLTGANMAGKSTFMKSLGIAAYLAHMGFPVAATKMEFSVMDGIYTTINLPDNLGMGTSHFYAEVLRIKKIAKALGQGNNLFVIIDELFRGTNVKDAYEATIAITEAFATKRNAMFIISTHIIEAGEILSGRCQHIKFQYLPTHMDGNKPVYTHKLAEGITSDRHGMIIINNEGILDILKQGRMKLS